MAQLSIYDKQRHFSNKDFTCSIGKHDYIYITFRHDTWKLFTTSEQIAVTRTDSGAFKFSDPKTCWTGKVFKLKKNNHGDQNVAEHTRYLQIDGAKYPGFLEVARCCVGSYDFTKTEDKNENPEPPKKAEDIKDPAKTLWDVLQVLVNNAVELAFEAHIIKNTELYAEAYEAGRKAGIAEGREEAKKDYPSCCEPKDKDAWAIP